MNDIALLNRTEASGIRRCDEFSSDPQSRMSSTSYQSRNLSSEMAAGSQVIQRMVSSDSYFCPPPSVAQPYPAGEYRPQSLAYAMTINPADVSTGHMPLSTSFNGAMTSVKPTLSEKEAQGTMESPFCSDALQREAATKSSLPIIEPATDGSSPSSSPDPEEQTETSNIALEEDRKPVVPLLSKPGQPPRPPNAWILYRSERLRAIAAGEPIPGLLAVLKEQSLVRALDDSQSRIADFKESSDSPEPNRFQLFKDGEPSSSSQMDVKEQSKNEAGSKYRRALLQADISKVISMMWKREGKEIKSKYEAMAEAKKLEVSSRLWI